MYFFPYTIHKRVLYIRMYHVPYDHACMQRDASNPSTVYEVPYPLHKLVLDIRMYIGYTNVSRPP